MFVFTGIDEISEEVYKGVDHSDSEDSEKSDSSDSEFLSDEEHKPKSSNQDEKDKAERKWPKASADGDTKDGVTGKAAPETALKDKQASNGPERDLQDKPVTPQSQLATEKPKAPEEGRAAAAKSAAEQDSDSERELVIDLGDEQGGHESKKARRDAGASTAKPSKECNVAKVEGELSGLPSFVAMFGPSNIIFCCHVVFSVQIGQVLYAFTLLLGFPFIFSLCLAQKSITKCTFQNGNLVLIKFAFGLTEQCFFLFLKR